MRRATPRFIVLATMFAVGVMIARVDRAQAAPDRDSSANVCENGTVASYIGTTCSLPPAVYRWTSYECTSTPSNLCNRLGKNGDEIHMRRDPNGPNTILVGGTDRWNVKAGETINIMIRGQVYGATGNLTWPHFKGQRAATGDGYEENITKVDCGDNCTFGNGESRFRCEPGGPEENCTDQTRIGPYHKSRGEFRVASSDSPYPFSIEIKMSGGTNGTASLHSLGLHLSAYDGPGAGRQGRFGQGRRQRFP